MAILTLTLTLALFCHGNQDTFLRSSILRRNLSDKNIRLDPILRKALLRALVELEKEAEEKLRAEETRNVRAEPQGSTGNFLQNIDDSKQEIHNTAESAFPTSTAKNLLGSNAAEENFIEQNAESNTPTSNAEDFQFSTPSSITNEIITSVQESKSSDSIDHSNNLSSNFISDDVDNKEKIKIEEEELSRENRTEESKEGQRTDAKVNEVELFQAPLVAAFTLHQDSKGTPHSVIPLFSKNPITQQQRLATAQQFANLKQQQFLQNQFIPSVSLTPLSPVNQFDQSTRFFFPSNNFAASTVFPPLLSNSIISQSFPSAIIPSQTFQAPTTLTPHKGNVNNFITTNPPQRNQAFSQTLLPPQEFNGVSTVQTQNINFRTSPPPNFTPSPGLQPLNIPPVTLPLQNEARFQSPIIVPSLQVSSNQASLENQDQEKIRNRLALQEQNRKRIIEEQNRQRQIQEQNRQRQLEEERQKQLYEQQIRQQRQEHGVDFQKSVGFTFNQNVQHNFRPPLRSANNAFNFIIQPSQTFVPSLTFSHPESGHRVNRQEGFGSTGNFGFRNFESSRNHFQSNQIFPTFSGPQEYRTIPEEHYRNVPINHYHQVNRFPQFSQPQNNFVPNTVEDVNKKLQNLLFQSGVARDASGQEDLNIVSKVLALNHERSDTNVGSTIVRNERKLDYVSHKNLGVGEIKDAAE